MVYRTCKMGSSGRPGLPGQAFCLVRRKWQGALHERTAAQSLNTARVTVHCSPEIGPSACQSVQVQSLAASAQ